MLETVGSLRRNYRQVFSPEHGDCLLIPTKDFKPEWKNGLLRQGHQVLEKQKWGAGKDDVVLIKMEYSATIAQLAKDLPDEEPPSISSKIDDNSSSKTDELNVRKGIVSGANVAVAAAKIPKPEEPYKRNYGHPPGNKAGLVHRGKKWLPELEQLLKQHMECRELVELPMPIRARRIKQMQPDPFPDRTVIGLVQHYKQITTPAQRAAALVEAQKPPIQRPRWESMNSKQERYTLKADGLQCTGIVTFENGKIERVSAVVTPETEGNGQAKAVLVNDLPVDVLKLLNGLIEQLQETQQ